MAVAKSYQELEIVGDVFVSSGRQYVNVKLRSGKLKTVRWYSDYEYAKMYPTAEKVSEIKHTKTQKEVLGFTEGYITIFKGETYPHKEWFREHGCHYGKSWGWAFKSTDELPSDLPEGVEPVRLDWDLVGNEDGWLKPDHVVKEAVENLIYDGGDSEWIGEVGERLDLYLTVERTVSLEGNYGHSTMHLMRDEYGNLYVWTTASKCWPAGSEKHIRGTVKDHRKYRNECQTVLTRCQEVK